MERYVNEICQRWLKLYICPGTMQILHKAREAKVKGRGRKPKEETEDEDSDCDQKDIIETTETKTLPLSKRPPQAHSLVSPSPTAPSYSVPLPPPPSYQAHPAPNVAGQGPYRGAIRDLEVIAAQEENEAELGLRYSDYPVRIITNARQK